MNIQTINASGFALTDNYVAGTVDEVSVFVLNEEASRITGQEVAVGDGDNDFLYFFNNDSECLARVNLYEPDDIV